MKPRPVALVAAAGALSYAGAIALAVSSDHAGTGVGVATVAAGLSFTTSGVVALARRPENPTGWLMLAAGFLWAVSSLSLTDSSSLATLGLVFEQLAFAPLAHLLLAYPTGVLERRLHRRIVAAVWAAVLVGPLAISLVTPRPAGCDDCPESAFLVWDDHAASVAVQVAYTLAAIALALAVAVQLARRYRAATPPRRRTLRPIYVLFLVALVLLIAGNATGPVSHPSRTGLGVAAIVAIALVPVAFLAGLLRGRLARLSVADLVMALEQGAPLRDALARALGDPSVELRYWIGEREQWVDADGRAAPEPVPDRKRSVRIVERGGSRVAAIVHDRSLDEDPALVDAVASAAGLSLQNERLQAELRAQYAFLSTIVETAPSLLVNVGVDGRILDLNPATVRATGLDDEEQVRGRPFWEVFVDEPERDASREGFLAAAPGYPPVEYESAFTNARGERVAIAWRTAPVRGADGRVTSVIAGGIDITERKRRELELQRERDATDTLVQSIPTLVVVVDENAVILSHEGRSGINRAFRDTFGWSDEDVAGRSLVELIHPDDRFAAVMGIASAANGVPAVERESRWRCADGRLVVVEWTATPMPDPSELERKLVLISATDVTERVRHEEELRRQRDLLTTIARSTPSLMAVVDATGLVSAEGVNRAFEETIGFSDEESRGRPFLELVGAPAEADALAAAASPDGVGVEHESTWRSRTGEELRVAWSTQPLDLGYEQPRYLVHGVDVTERKRREEEIVSAGELLRAVIESAPVAIAEFDAESRILLWNPAAERMFGWRAEEVQGRVLWELVPEERREELREMIARELEGQIYTGVETARRRRDGTLVDVEISAAPVRDATGAVVSRVVVFTDISERKRQAEEIRASRARIVQAADEARRRLERDLHDGAQQRLVALSVSLRLAEAKLATAPQEAAAVLAGARVELAHALEELRELARGIHPAVLTDRGLAAAVDALVSRSPVPVDAELPTERLPPAVEAALYYVVSESLANVAKHAGASSVCVRIVHTNGAAAVEVADDGAGGADPERGSGLRGLLDRVEALNGTLVVDSPPGGGTRVRAEVPLR